MASYVDYAALSAFIYNNARGNSNQISIPQAAGWAELPIDPSTDFTGFTAAAFQNSQTQEIVIAFKGTDTDNLLQTVKDFVFGNSAALGGSVQLFQAALFYEQVKAKYGSNITFTGHSLGGGMASVKIGRAHV